jgi:hypothetical protein
MDQGTVEKRKRARRVVGSIHIIKLRRTDRVRLWLQEVLPGDKSKRVGGPFDTMREAEREREKILASRKPT